MTRIVAGSARGRRLAVPTAGVRPTGDRAREGLFNSLVSLIDLPGARVLDLYAGSGALGLEALSRGAAEVVLVENGPRVLPVLRANVAALGLPGARVVARSVPALVAGPAVDAFDLVLADPPYAVGAAAVRGVLRALAGGGWCAAEAIAVVERPSREPPWDWPTPWTGLRDRRYGEAMLRYGRAP